MPSTDQKKEATNPSNEGKKEKNKKEKQSDRSWKQEKPIKIETNKNVPTTNPLTSTKSEQNKDGGNQNT